MKDIKTLHIITKLAIGGAQENTIYSAEYFNHKKGFSSQILCGPTDNSSGSLESEARERGILIKKIRTLSNKFSILGYICAVIAMRAYIKKNKFTIVHTHSSVGGILGRLAAKLAGTPLIIHTVHGWGLQPKMNPLKKKLYILLERCCARFTDKLIVVAKDNIKKGKRYKIGKRSQYVVIRSGIDPEKFSQKSAKIPITDSSSSVVGTIGRLDHQKCPEDFIKVAEKVIKKKNDVSFVFVGDGPLRDKVERLIRQKRLQKHVHLLGFRRDTAAILQSIDIFLLTSIHEGLPKVVLQAMAVKKPVVATAVDGTPEAVLHGKTGLLARVHDTTTLANHITYLIENPSIGKEMGVQGFKSLNEFSVEKMLSDLDGLYTRLLKMKNDKKNI